MRSKPQTRDLKRECGVELISLACSWFETYMRAACHAVRFKLKCVIPDFDPGSRIAMFVDELHNLNNDYTNVQSVTYTLQYRDVPPVRQVSSWFPALTQNLSASAGPDSVLVIPKHLQ